MSSFAACAAVLALLATPAWAEQKKDTSKSTAQQLAERTTQKMTEPLGLSKKQAAKVEKVMQSDLQRKQGIFDAYKGRIDESTIEQLREELEASQDQTRAELEPILSTEQLAEFDAVQQEQRAQAAGELMVHRLQERLALTSEQREQLVPLFADHIARQQSMLQEARSSGGRGMRAMRAMRGKNQTLQRELEKQLQPILDEEQMQAYLMYRKETQAEMRQRMRDRGAWQR
jgi:gas vesicle protein